MKRRSKVSGKRVKAQGSGASKLKRRAAQSKTAALTASPVVGAQREVPNLVRELNEAREQLAATSEVLHAISSSRGDLQPIFQSMLSNAARLCEAKFGSMWLAEGDGFRPVALHNVPPVLAAGQRPDQIIRFLPETPVGRVARTKRLVHVADIRSDPGYAKGFAPLKELADVGGARTLLMVPMLKEHELAGVYAIYRLEVRPFTDQQISLVQNFAAQAVIAIENARLLNELRQRTTDLSERTVDLSEALEQQTATSDVLQVISSSPGDLEPVFATMLQKAVSICDAGFGNIYRVEGDGLRIVATHNTPPVFAEARKSSPYFTPGPKSPLRRMMTTKAVVHVLDNAATEAYAEGDPGSVAAVELGGARTVLYVPLLKENELVGAFTLSRQEVWPFADKQIELVKSFAAQAVIAIENTRLLNELRQSLEQQTATSDVLTVISRSAFDLQAVLETLVQAVARLCMADKSAIMQRDGDVFRTVANFGFPPELMEWSAEHPLPGDRASATGRAALERRAIHIPDVLADPEYGASGHQQEAGYRTTLAVPLLREGTAIGVFGLLRDEVNPFTENQIALVENFAAQAVIAIENARLLEELRHRTTELTEALEQQTATADVLKVISRSQFDLQLVLDNLIQTATSLCSAKRGVIFRRDGDLYRAAAFHNATPELIEFVKNHPIAPGRHTITARVALERRVIHVSDLQADKEYTYALRDTEPIRTELGVPMFRGDDLVGVFILYKLKVEPFTDKQIELVTTFADQAVIAIENVRLLSDLAKEPMRLRN